MTIIGVHPVLVHERAAIGWKLAAGQISSIAAACEGKGTMKNESGAFAKVSLQNEDWLTRRDHRFHCVSKGPDHARRPHIASSLALVTRRAPSSQARPATGSSPSSVPARRRRGAQANSRGAYRLTESVGLLSDLGPGLPVPVAGCRDQSKSLTGSQSKQASLATWAVSMSVAFVRVHFADRLNWPRPGRWRWPSRTLTTTALGTLLMPF